MVLRSWVLFVLSLGSSLSPSWAASITNADTGGNLTAGASWVGHVAPGASDVAVWATNRTSGTSALGGAASWAGIQILSPTTPIVISSDGNTLTLGALGVDMSLAANILTLDCLVTLGANQNWNVASGQTLTVEGTVSGSGTLTKTGSGTLTLNGKDSGTGLTAVLAGDLVLASSGLISCPISVAAGATFDVSQSSVFSLIPNQSLSGSGTVVGPLSALLGGTISPGGAGVAGTLTISNGLAENGGVSGVTNFFMLSKPGGANDLLSVIGDLDVNNTNTITLSEFGGGAIPFGTYPLITYTGSFNGGITNFTLTPVGVSAILTNITTTTPRQIAVVLSPSSLPLISREVLSAGGTTITLSATNGTALRLAVVLTSPNIALPFADWTPVATNNFDGSGDLLNLPVPASPTATQQFFVIEEY
jgi:hypothetical protein